MVVCAELSTECNNKQSTNSGYFKLSHFDREVLARDANNNGNSTTNNNNNNQNANTNSTYSTSNSLFDASRDSIKSFYQNSVILVTGGTGFLGKVLLEKLLRSCEDIQCIYVLLRSKRGLSSEERYKELIQNPVFDRVRQSNPERLKKVIFISGDISKPNIGLNSNDLNLLIEHVNIVFHSAATVRFDQNIREAVNLNTLGSKRLWDLCSDMKKLKSIIHVSTAYTNPTRRIVGETVYPPKIDLDTNTFLKCVNTLPDNLVSSIATQLQGEHPNTYTLTKSMAEQIAVEYHHRLPISIVRPSIVTGAVAEPFPGWVDNINGITGIIMEIGRGTISSIMCDKELILDIIPVDIVCNMIITAAWLNYHEPTNSVRVYNCTSGQLNPLIWEDCRRKVLKYSRKYPSKYVMLYPNFSYRKNRFIHLLYEIFLHFLPAFFYDLYMKSQGMKPMMMNIAKRYKSAADTGEFFAMHEWDFEVSNVKELTKQVSLTNEHHEYMCDVTKIDWDEYLKNYVFGIREYILKDDLSTMKDARKMVKKLYLLKLIVQTVFIFAISSIFYNLMF